MKKDQFLRNTIILILRQSKLILIFALIAAILGAGYGMLTQSAPQNQDKLSRLVTERQQMQDSLAHAKQVKDSLYQYFGFHPEGTFDYEKIHQYSYVISASINADYPEAIYAQKNAALATSMQMAYSTALLNNTVKENLSAIFNDSIMAEYAYRIIDIIPGDSYNNNNNNYIYTVKVITYHVNEQVPSQVLDAISDYILNEVQTAQKDCIVQAYPLQAIRVDPDLKKKDTAFIRADPLSFSGKLIQTVETVGTEISTVSGKLNKINSDIASLQPNLRSNIIKFGLMGCAIGLVLAVLWILFIDTVNVKIRNKSDLSDYTDLHFLGYLSHNSDKWVLMPTKLLKWLGDDEAVKSQPTEKLPQLAGANISLILKSHETPVQSLAYISSTELSPCKSALNAIQLPDSVSAVTADNILSNPDSLYRLKDADSVVIVEQRGKCSFSELDCILDKMSRAKLTVAGILLY